MWNLPAAVAAFLRRVGRSFAAADTPDDALSQEERIRHLASFPQLNPNPVMEVDRSGEVVYCNPAVHRFLAECCLGDGAASMFLPHDMDRILPELDAQKASSHYREVIVGGRIFGQTVQLVPQFRMVRLYAYDITERRVAEKERESLLAELELQAAELDAVFKVLPYLVSVHGVDGRFLRVNPALVKLFGLNPVSSTREDIARRLNARFPDGRPITRENMPSNPAFEGETVSGVEYLITDGEGEEHVLLMSATPLLLEGRVHGVVVAQVDITERKRAEEELQKAHNELEVRVRARTEDLATTVEILLGEIAERERAEKALREENLERLRAVEALREKEQMLLHQSRLAAMGEMINNIAHQWRQPLNVLALVVQQLRMEHELGSFSREILDGSVNKAMALISHMSQTIDDFRNFFKPDKEPVAFRIHEVVERTLSLIADGFRSQNIHVEFLARARPSVTGFPNEYSQVLLNILMNARDVLLERRTADATISVTIDTQGERSVVTIADNAGGIVEEIMGKIFEPYFTTKGPDRGTGVGLFMSKTIIEKNMHGMLTARNTAEGAEFRIVV